MTLPDSTATPVISQEFLEFWYSAHEKKILFHESVFILKSQKVWLASLVVCPDAVTFWKRPSDFLPEWARQYENFELRGQKDVVSNLQLEVPLDCLEYLKFFQLANRKRVVLMRDKDGRDLVFGFETDQVLSTFLLFLTRRKALFKGCRLEGVERVSGLERVSGVSTKPVRFPPTPKHLYLAKLDLVPDSLSTGWFAEVNARLNRFDELAFAYPLFPNLFPSSLRDLETDPRSLVRNTLENFQTHLEGVQRDFHLKTREKCHLFDLSPYTLEPFSPKSWLSCTSLLDFCLLPEVYLGKVQKPPESGHWNSCKPRDPSFFESKHHTFHRFLHELALALREPQLKKKLLTWLVHTNFTIHQLDVFSELARLKNDVLKVVDGKQTVCLFDRQKARLLRQLGILQRKLDQSWRPFRRAPRSRSRTTVSSPGRRARVRVRTPLSSRRSGCTPRSETRGSCVSTK